MNRFTLIVISICAVVMLMVIGCSSSEQTTQQQQPTSSPSSPTPSAQQQNKEQPPNVDTINVDVQNTPKPNYQPKTSEPIVPAEKFTVQIGAYKMAESAERIAALAKERFGKNVYTIPDKIKDVYKVMVGDFSVKDEARRFRDEMVQQYPSDYKDAWVSELPQN